MAGWELVEACGGCGFTDVSWDYAVVSPFLRSYVFDVAPCPKGILAGRCRGCGLGFFNMRLDREAIERLYLDYRGEEYTRCRCLCEPGYSEIAKSLGEVEGAVVAERRRLIEAFLEGVRGSVLDYAGDRGQFIPEWFDRKTVYDLSGVEPVAGVERVEKADGRWDLVMACQLLEHVPDLQTFLGQLRPHGESFYFEVPLEPWDRKGGVPQLHEHCNFFLDDEVLPAILKKAGYRIERRRVVAVDCGYARAAFQQVLATPVIENESQ